MHSGQRFRSASSAARRTCSTRGRVRRSCMTGSRCSLSRLLPGSSRERGSGPLQGGSPSCRSLRRLLLEAPAEGGAERASRLHGLLGQMLSYRLAAGQAGWPGRLALAAACSREAFGEFRGLPGPASRSVQAALYRGLGPVDAGRVRVGVGAVTPGLALPPKGTWYGAGRPLMSSSPSTSMCSLGGCAAWWCSGPAIGCSCPGVWRSDTRFAELLANDRPDMRGPGLLVTGLSSLPL